MTLGARLVIKMAQAPWRLTNSIANASNKENIVMLECRLSTEIPIHFFEKAKKPRYFHIKYLHSFECCHQFKIDLSVR